MHVDRKKPKNGTTGSKNRCFCPGPRLCTCLASTPPAGRELDDSRKLCEADTTLEVHQEQGNSAQMKTPESAASITIKKGLEDKAGRDEDLEDKARLDEKLRDKTRQDENLEEKTRQDEDLGDISEMKIFGNLFGNSCWVAEGGKSAEVDIFVSDEEDDVEDFKHQDAVGALDEPGRMEERRKQEELVSLMSKIEDMLSEKTSLEQDNKQLVSERIHQDQELEQAKNCIKELNEEMRALKDQQTEEKEMMKKVLESAKASNKVLREKMEAVQEQFREKEVRERVLEQTLTQMREIQEKLSHENKLLAAELHRLTGTNGYETAFVTQAPSPVQNYLAPMMWICPTCAFHNRAADHMCGMCR